MALAKVCSVEGCGKPASKRGWCGTHYQRWRLHGDVTVLKGLPNGTCLRWIHDNVDHQGQECLIWPFSRKVDTGYAQMTYEGRNVHSHRVMCSLAHGEPPDPLLDAAHSCGKGHLGCINPTHLRWATRSSNLLEKRAHGTVAHGESTSSAVLTEGEVQEIVALSATLSERRIAKQFGVHRSTVNCILSGRSWSWLTGIARAA